VTTAIILPAILYDPTKEQKAGLRDRPFALSRGLRLPASAQLDAGIGNVLGSPGPARVQNWRHIRDLDLLLDLIYGPLCYRLLLRHAPLYEGFIEQAAGRAGFGAFGLGPEGRMILAVGGNRPTTSGS
jgi:hypothetical protein